MADKEIFDGEAVLSFDDDQDRRNFLKWAGIVGVGSTLAVGGIPLVSSSCSRATCSRIGRPARGTIAPG